MCLHAKASLFFQTADSYSLCWRSLLLHHKAPTLQRHGTLWLYQFVEPWQAVIRCPGSDEKTHCTEMLSGAGIICNASRCSITTGEIRTLPDLQGTTWTELHSLHFYTPDKFSIVAEHEVKLLEEATPATVEQLDKVKSQLTKSQLTFDPDLLLHIHKTSLRQEHQTQWHFTLTIILSSVFILVILLLLFRSYFIRLVLHCCPANRKEQKAIEQTPSPHPPQPTQRTRASNWWPTKECYLRVTYNARQLITRQQHWNKPGKPHISRPAILKNATSTVLQWRARHWNTTLYFLWISWLMNPQVF